LLQFVPEEIKKSFTNINKLIENYQNLRLVIPHFSEISMKSDRNGKYLGTAGPFPVYWVIGAINFASE
jgi:hypothetical protein